jgi:hypothetical protein
MDQAERKGRETSRILLRLSSLRPPLPAVSFSHLHFHFHLSYKSTPSCRSERSIPFDRMKPV